MIELHFVKRGNLRKTYIKDRVITMITPELSYQPLTLDVNKAAMYQDEYMTKQLEVVGLKNFEGFTSDQAIADDIIKDFQESGWRCVKR